MNQNTKRAAELVAAVYAFSSVGGNAHIVVDDFNLEDRHIESCLKEVLEGEDAEEQLQAERECLEAFKGLTLDERASALAIHEGWINLNQES